MRSYGQYCPMAMAVELLGDRWTLLLVRDLLCGVHHFNDFERGLPGISRALLAQRLRRLQHDGIVERRVSGTGRSTEYHLTHAGQELKEVVDALTTWGARYAFGEPDPAHLNPVLLLWWIRGGVHRDRLPPRRVVVQFDFHGARTETLWLLLEPGDVSICIQHPGFEIDLLVSADIAALYRWWVGRLNLGTAMRDGSIQLDGPTALVRAFPTWLAGSPAAETVRTALAHPAQHPD